MQTKNNITADIKAITKKSSKRRRRAIQRLYKIINQTEMSTKKRFVLEAMTLQESKLDLQRTDESKMQRERRNMLQNP